MSDKKKIYQVSVAGSEVYYGDDILKAKRVYRNMCEIFYKNDLNVDVEIRRPHK